MFINAWTLITLTLFINVLVMGNQAWLSMKPPSLLKLLLFWCISIASFTRWSMNPGVLSLLRYHWTDAMTHTDAMFCHCWFLELKQTYLSMVLFAPHLDSMSPLSYIYFLHSHGFWQTLRTLNSNPYLTDLNHLCGFPFLVCELFWYYVSPKVYWFYCWWCDKTVSWLYLWALCFATSVPGFVIGLIWDCCDCTCFVWRLI